MILTRQRRVIAEQPAGEKIEPRDQESPRDSAPPRNPREQAVANIETAGHSNGRARMAACEGRLHSAQRCRETGHSTTKTFKSLVEHIDVIQDFGVSGKRANLGPIDLLLLEKAQGRR